MKHESGVTRFPYISLQLLECVASVDNEKNYYGQIYTGTQRIAYVPRSN